jgi:hypothetical protein
MVDIECPQSEGRGLKLKQHSIGRPIWSFIIIPTIFCLSLLGTSCRLVDFKQIDEPTTTLEAKDSVNDIEKLEEFPEEHGYMQVGLIWVRRVHAWYNPPKSRVVMWEKAADLGCDAVVLVKGTQMDVDCDDYSIECGICIVWDAE